VELGMEKAEQKQKRVYIGEVISNDMEKTIVVKIRRTFTHDKFHKIIRTDKKYKVHDPLESASVGDIVEFSEGRPVSKTKYMYLTRIVKKADTAA
jgi:small subunit ribosomal protein S17